MKRFSILLSPLAAFALLLANSASTNTSYMWMYQPKFPEKLRKL